MSFIDSALDSISGAVGDMATSVLGGGISYLGQSSANSMNQQIAQMTTSANAAEAQKNRDWQERMRATQYQTAVQDLMAAGLNPMLAYSQGGSGTPSGAVGAAANGKQFLFDAFFDIRMARPMPMYSVPGLIDHF